MYETEPFLYGYDFETASTRITIKSLTSIVKKESLHNGLQRKRGGGEPLAPLFGNRLRDNVQN